MAEFNIGQMKTYFKNLSDWVTGSGNPAPVQLTGSKVGLATDPMPVGNEGETYLQYDEDTQETKVFKFIGGDWREL